MGKDWYSSQFMSLIVNVNHGEEGRPPGTAYFYATSPCMIHRPTGNKPDIEPWARQGLHQSAPILNTSGSDSIVWESSQAVSYDAMSKGRQ